MARFSRDDLVEVYTWTDVDPEDPRISGVPDKTDFDSGHGHEVLFLINALMSEWDLINKKSGGKMERMIKDLPAEICCQEEARDWIKEKWKSYKFKSAKGKALKMPKPQIPETVQEPVVSGEEHHHYCTSCNSVKPCTVIELPMSEPSDTHILQALSGIHYLKRMRQCTHCNNQFETVEIESNMLYELMRMKSLVDKFTTELDTATNKDNPW